MLRAWRITTAPMLIFVVSMWGVGLGGGYALAFHSAGRVPEGWQGARGFWIAATAGLILAAVLLSALLAWVLAQHRDDHAQGPARPAA